MEGRIKGELSASVLGFCLCGGLAGEGSAWLYPCLAAVWCASHTNATFACAKNPCVEVLHHPSHPLSACVVNLFVI